PSAAARGRAGADEPRHPRDRDDHQRDPPSRAGGHRRALDRPGLPRRGRRARGPGRAWLRRRARRHRPHHHRDGLPPLRAGPRPERRIPRGVRAGRDDHPPHRGPRRDRRRGRRRRPVLPHAHRAALLRRFRRCHPRPGLPHGRPRARADRRAAPAHPRPAAHGPPPPRSAPAALLRGLRPRDRPHRAAARRRLSPLLPDPGQVMTIPHTTAAPTDRRAPGRGGVLLDMTLLFALVLGTIVVAEAIGIRALQITPKVTITLLPLVFAVVLTMLLGVPVWRKGILRRIYSPRNVGFSGAFLIVIMLPLMARYGADVAPRLAEIISIGWVFLLQELGNLGTVLLGLPVALMLGLRRHAIGSTLGLGREGELAYISEKYTLNSDPGRGVLSMYLMGTLFGALFFSFFAPVLLGTGIDVRALAIASGMGSASMMTAASSTLAAQVPDLQDTIVSYAAASQLLTSFIGTYTMVFLAVPLQRAFYNLMMRGKDRLPAGGTATMIGADAPIAGSPAADEAAA